MKLKTLSFIITLLTLSPLMAMQQNELFKDGYSEADDVNEQLWVQRFFLTIMVKVPILPS